MPKKHPDVPLVIDFHTHMLDAELLDICVNRNAITGFGQRKENRSPHLRRFLEPELQRGVAQLGHKAVMLPTNVDSDYLGDRKFWPLWEAIRALDVPVFIHPEGIRDAWYRKFALWNSIGQQIEEAKVAASLIYEGLLDAVPGLKIVIAHGGGYFATCMGRLDRNIEKPETRVNIGHKRPSEYLRHF